MKYQAYAIEKKLTLKKGSALYELSEKINVISKNNQRALFEINVNNKKYHFLNKKVTNLINLQYKRGFSKIK